MPQGHEYVVYAVCLNIVKLNFSDVNNNNFILNFEQLYLVLSELFNISGQMYSPMHVFQTKQKSSKQCPNVIDSC